MLPLLSPEMISRILVLPYRWFPTGKIIFVAPTRPLVDQQMGACFSITDISRERTVQLTGQTMAPADRKREWDARNVFFCTPQVLLPFIGGASGAAVVGAALCGRSSER